MVLDIELLSCVNSSFFTLKLQKKILAWSFRDLLRFVWVLMLCMWRPFVHQFSCLRFMRRWLGTPSQFQFVRGTFWTFQPVFSALLSHYRPPKSHTKVLLKVLRVALTLEGEGVIFSITLEALASWVTIS